MDDKMATWLKVFLVTLCFAVSLFILWIYLPFSDDISLDEEYAVLAASDAVVTQIYPIDRCDSIQFFYDNHGKRTLFINKIPNVKIVNDEEYYLELTTNQSIHDIINLSNNDRVLIVDIKDDYYHRIHEDDPSYDYDYGLYVDCTAFDITVHAPISDFRTNTQTVLDFDAASAACTFIHFSYEGTQANIYNIDTQNLTVYCSGSSDIALSGSAANNASLNIWHDTHIDATQLTTNRIDTFVSNQPFGLSYIQFADSTAYSFDLGIILTFILVFFPILWLVLDIAYIRKLIKTTKETCSMFCRHSGL